MDAQKKVTRGELLAPLLRALNDLGEGAHPFALIVEKAITGLGLPIDCMGLEPGGRPAVLNPASNAGHTLRERGLVLTEGRGNWRLTQLGRDVSEGRVPMPSAKKTFAQEPQPQQGQVISGPTGASPPPPFDVAPQTGVQRRLPVLDSDGGAPEWVRDPYIRSVVAANTKCYSSWSPVSEACSGCHLQRHCRQAQAATLSILASILAKDEQLSRAAKQLHSDVHNQIDPKTSRNAPGDLEGRPLKAPYDGLCMVSGNTIRKGDDCWYVPGQGLISNSAYEQRKGS